MMREKRECLRVVSFVTYFTSNFRLITPTLMFSSYQETVTVIQPKTIEVSDFIHLSLLSSTIHLLRFFLCSLSLFDTFIHLSLFIFTKKKVNVIPSSEMNEKSKKQSEWKVCLSSSFCLLTSLCHTISKMQKNKRMKEVRREKEGNKKRKKEIMKNRDRKRDERRVWKLIEGKNVWLFVSFFTFFRKWKNIFLLKWFTFESSLLKNREE